MDPPPVYYHPSASADSSTVDVRRAGYGSLSDTPSIISVPPSLSPPPSAMPFPPLFLSSHSLRTISAKDLEKSCIWYQMLKTVCQFETSERQSRRSSRYLNVLVVLFYLHTSGNVLMLRANLAEHLENAKKMTFSVTLGGGKFWSPLILPAVTC